MASAYNNLSGWIRDVRSARKAAHEGESRAGELLDALCDELDVLLDFGGEDDEGGDGGHDEGSDDTEGVESRQLEVPHTRDNPSAPPAEGMRRQYSARGGSRPAVLVGAQSAERKVLLGPKQSPGK